MTTTRTVFALLFLLSLAACRTDLSGVDPDPHVPQRALLDFDGLDDRLVAASDEALNLDSSFTVEAWIYAHDVKAGVASGGGERTILRKGYTTISDPVLYRRTNNYHLFLDVKDGPGILAFQNARTPRQKVKKETWHHVAGVFSVADTVSTIYLDGRQVAQAKGDTLPAQNKAPVVFGISLQRNGVVQDAFDGTIADVRIWETARTEAQIQEHMRRKLAGNEEGLVAYYPMDDGRGQTIADSAGTNPAFRGMTEAEEDVDPSWTPTDDPHFEEEM